MRFSPWSLMALVAIARGLVTLETINRLTAEINEFNERIFKIGGPYVVEGVANGMAVVQVHVDGKKNELESSIAATLRLFCDDLLVELEKPLDAFSQASVSSRNCQIITDDYYEFLAATVKYIHEIQLRQQRWQWHRDSPVVDGLSRMQGLWASRKSNAQRKSFIEQQMTLYTATGCFGKSREVLRRGVEVVEYLNDMIESFHE